MDKTALSFLKKLIQHYRQNEIKREVLLDRKVGFWAKNVFPHQYMYLKLQIF